MELEINEFHKRLAFSAIGMLVFIIVIYFGFLPFLFFISLLVVFGLLEFYSMIRDIGFSPNRYFGIILSLLILLFFFLTRHNINFSDKYKVFIPLLITSALIYLFVAAILKKSIDKSVLDIALTFFGVFYVGWLLGHLILIRELPFIGREYMYMICFVIWTLDVTAYFVGVKFGKHRIAPAISPKKSFEGGLAGLLGAILVAVLCKYIFLRVLTFFNAVTIGFIIGVFGQVGDFAESLIKRSANKKDSGNIIPGHGGVLDRFDSMIFAAPLVYYYLRLIS